MPAALVAANVKAPDCASSRGFLLVSRCLGSKVLQRDRQAGQTAGILQCNAFTAGRAWLIVAK
jgi:hypothetical protein